MESKILTAEELVESIADMDARDRRVIKAAATDAPMLVSQHFDPYDTTRWGRPWIAKVLAYNGIRPVLVFGRKFEGTAVDGGTCSAYAVAGDILRWGQKSKSDKVTAPEHWGIVSGDGTIRETTKHECWENYTKDRKDISSRYFDFAYSSPDWETQNDLK